MKDQIHADALKAYVALRDSYYAASNAALRAERDAEAKQTDLATATAAYEATHNAANFAKLAIASGKVHRAKRAAEVKWAAAEAAGVAYEAATDA